MKTTKTTDEYITDSDSDESSEEAEFLKMASIKFSENPVDMTHGVNIVCDPKNQLVDLKNRSSNKAIRFEVDAFRVKYDDQRRAIIQIVENKSFQGANASTLTSKNYDTWLNKINNKVSSLCDLQENMKTLGPDTVTIRIKKPGTKRNQDSREITDQNKLYIIEMIIQCNAIKFRFAKKDMPSEFLEQLKERLKTVGTDSKLRLTCQYGRDDAHTDELHYEARKAKYKQKSTPQPVEPTFDEKITGVKELKQRYHKWLATIEDLKNDKYPVTLPPVTLVLDEVNNSCKQLKTIIKKYNAGKAKVVDFEKFIGYTIKPLGYTASFTHELVKEGDKIKEIKVVTSPTKYSLMLVYEANLADLRKELDRLAPPTPPVQTLPIGRPRRSALSPVLVGGSSRFTFSGLPHTQSGSTTSSSSTTSTTTPPPTTRTLVSSIAS